MKTLAACFVACLAGVFVGCADKPNQNGNGNNTTTQVTNTSPKQLPNISFDQTTKQFADTSFDQISADWKINSVKAENDYYGKWFKVKGEVSTINNFDGAVIVGFYLTYTATTPNGAKRHYSCGFMFTPGGENQLTTEADKQAVIKLKVGEEATISGKLSHFIPGKLGGVPSTDSFCFTHAAVEAK